MGYQDLKGDFPTILNQAVFLDLWFLPGPPGGVGGWGGNNLRKYT